MVEQGRTEGGQFAPKSEEYRHVRSIRLTDSAWEALGAAASERGITRADLIEQLVEQGVIGSTRSPEKTESEIEQLIDQVLADSAVTRRGKDRGAVRRGLRELLRLWLLT